MSDETQNDERLKELLWEEHQADEERKRLLGKLRAAGSVLEKVGQVLQDDPRRLVVLNSPRGGINVPGKTRLEGEGKVRQDWSEIGDTTELLADFAAYIEAVETIERVKQQLGRLPEPDASRKPSARS